LYIGNQQSGKGRIGNIGPAKKQNLSLTDEAGQGIFFFK
jgi:hypothetical protein